MKVIDLLNKIANGEEVPEEIIYNGKTYYVAYNNVSEKHYYRDDEDNFLLENIGSVCQLDEVIDEIIKDKKIEKLDTKDLFACDDYQHIRLNFGLTFSKINEIIDKINEGE